MISCLIQRILTLVEVRRGGEWEEEHPRSLSQRLESTINYLFLPQAREPKRSKGLYRGCGSGSENMSSIHQAFFILFQAPQMKELTIYSVGHWNSMGR